MMERPLIVVIFLMTAPLALCGAIAVIATPTLWPMAVDALASSPWYGALLRFLVGAFIAVLTVSMAGYSLGMIPALATGLICSFYPRGRMSRLTWLLACTATAATIMAGCAGLTPEELGVARFGWMALTGAAGGLLSATVVLWMERKRSSRAAALV